MADIPAISGADTGTWKSLVNAVISLINGKFNSRPYQWANAAARTAQIGMTVGEYGYQADTQVTYRATSATATEVWASPWITWTTAPTGITVGTGGSAASTQRYKYIAGRIYFDFKFVLGTSGASVGSLPNLNLPVSIAFSGPAGTIALQADGGGYIYDLSATSTLAYPRCFALTATTVRLNHWTSASPGIVGTSATVPMTWAAGDIFAGGFWADPA